jgi:hypothetical protein
VNLMRDCFHLNNLVYKEKTFHRHYRMSRMLFLEILDGVMEYDNYSEAKLISTSKVGFSSYKKCSAAIWHLAHY